MFKKFFASALVLIVLVAACIVPASAAELEDALVYDLKFSEGGAITDANEIADTFEVRSGTVPVFYDADLGMEVAEFGPEAQLVVKGAKIQDFKNMTIEMYLRITSESEEPLALLGVTNSGVGITVKKDSAVIGLGKGGDMELEPFVRNEWFHIVCSIGKTEQVIYVNGVEVGRKTGETSFVGSTHSTYIGRYFEDYETGMELALYKFYEAAATAEDAAAMYQAVLENKTSAESPSASAPEESDVTPVPSASNKPTENTKPTTAPTSEPAAETGMSGTTIAIIVVAAVVVIAAVAVILVVVFKKRKAK